MPQPRPRFEIYVYSPRVEGVHIRAVKVARGGSGGPTRKDGLCAPDPRLNEAQNVRMRLIVPVAVERRGRLSSSRPPHTEKFSAMVYDGYRTLIPGSGGPPFPPDYRKLDAETSPDFPAGIGSLPPSGGRPLLRDDPISYRRRGVLRRLRFRPRLGRDGFWLGDAFASAFGGVTTTRH